MHIFFRPSALCDFGNGLSCHTSPTPWAVLSPARQKGVVSAFSAAGGKRRTSAPLDVGGMPRPAGSVRYVLGHLVGYVTSVAQPKTVRRSAYSSAADAFGLHTHAHTHTQPHTSVGALSLPCAISCHRPLCKCLVTSGIAKLTLTQRGAQSTGRTMSSTFAVSATWSASSHSVHSRSGKRTWSSRS